MPFGVVPSPAGAARLAAGDPAALASWRRLQQQAADMPGGQADYVVDESRAAPTFAEWRRCPSCGINRAAGDDWAPGTACPLCAERGAPEPAGLGSARSLAYEPGPAERRMMAADQEAARLAGDEVRDANAGLRWLAEHARIRHEYR